MAADTPVVNTRSTLDQLYKVVYPKGVENALTDQTWFLANLDFQYIGETFKQPVKLTLPGGVTFGGINDTSSGAGGAYDLGTALASEGKKLNVEGYQITLRDQIGLGAAKAARKGEAAFQDATSDLFSGLQLSMSRFVEGSLVDGQSYTGQGVVESAGSVSGDNYKIVITAATWSPSRWVGKKGHKFVVWAPSGAAGTVPHSSTQRISTSNSLKCAKIVSVDYALRQITYTFDTASSGAFASIAANDIIYWANYKATDQTTAIGEWQAGTWNVCKGIVPAAGFTGTIWGQDNTNYELIRGATTSAGSTDLSFDTCGTALGKMWDIGATGEFTAFVSSETWNNLISPEVALRRHDASYKPEKVKVGHNEIEFTHLTGVLKIKPYAFMKQGEALICQPKLWKRVGSSDITFEHDMGDGKKKIFLVLADKNGYEVRCFSDQAPFTRRLGYAGYINLIVNS